VWPVPWHKKRLVNFKIAVVFGIPSVISIFLTRNYLLPLIPEEVFRINNLMITKDIFLLLIFAGLMMVASYKMIRKRKQPDEKQENKNNTLLAAGEGSVVGVLTGLVGAGEDL
jgi:uncharacterized membrane protein YfcA